MQTTGWPPGMLQDDSRELSRWLSTRLGARDQLQRNNMQANQTPEALAEEIMRAASAFAAAKLALYGRQDPSCGNPADLLYDLKFAINRLRDMAASRAKDADSFEQAAQPLMKWLGENVHPHHMAVVTSSSAELLEGKQTIRTTQYVKD